MIELDPRLVLTVLAVLWTLIAVVTLMLGAVHAVRTVRERGRTRLDARARPLVIRFALGEEEDPALLRTLRDSRGADARPRGTC